MSTSTWHSARTSGDQGLVIEEETGANIAVTYEAKHAPLVAAAPEMLAALKNAGNVLAALATGQLERIERNSPALMQIRDAIAKAQQQ